jgi:hypothetical protein
MDNSSTPPATYSPKSPGDPIFQDQRGWHFYDETWADSMGPFDTLEECRDALSRYCDYLDQPPSSRHTPPPPSDPQP